MVGNRVVDMFIIFPFFCLIFAIPLLSEVTCITNCCITMYTLCNIRVYWPGKGNVILCLWRLLSLRVNLVLPVFQCCLTQKCVLYILGPKTSCGNPFLPRERPLFTLLCLFCYRLRAYAKN